MERKQAYKFLFLRREHISDLFSGFDPGTISCLTLLKGHEAKQLSPAEISRLKYGCTCGSCVGGFLSLRMRETLLRTAEITYESINFDSSRDDDAERWCDTNDDVFRYLPEYIGQSFRVNKGMIIGFFCKLWKHLASCLRENKLPTETNILLLVRNGNGWMAVQEVTTTGERIRYVSDLKIICWPYSSIVRRHKQRGIQICTTSNAEKL